MRLQNNGRAILIALSLFAILALVLLESGLGSVHFNDPGALPGARAVSVSASVAGLVEQIQSVPLWRVIVFWGGLFLIVILLSSLLPPDMRRRFFRSMLRWMIVAIGIFFLIRYRGQYFLLQAPPPEQLDTSSDALPPTPELPEFSVPALPPILIYFLSVIILLIFIGIIWWFARTFIPTRPRGKGKSIVDELAIVTRQSLDEISSGRDWEDAVVRCYARMSDVVSRRRGLDRVDAMTPNEFASHLTRSGLPASAVDRLTRLFESVRYGDHSAGEREREEAAACLSDILRYCGESA